MPRTVDAQPAREHLKKLLRYTTKDNLVRSIGVARKTQDNLLDPSYDRVTERVSRIILAQTPGDRRLGQPRITARDQIDEFMHLHSLGVSVERAAQQIGVKLLSLGNMFRRAGVDVPDDVLVEISRAQNESRVA